MEKKPIIKLNAFKNRVDIKKIVFLDNCSDAPYYAADFSEDRNASVIGWHKWRDSETMYIAPTCGNKIYANKNSEFMFHECKNLHSIEGLENLDTSYVTNMNAMFAECSSLKELDLSAFNTSNVTNMKFMFYMCNVLKELDLSSFDTSNVTDMSCMFYCCTNLERINLSGFNTFNVKNMSYMFAQCNSLENIDISNFNISKVLTMSHMFDGCTNLVRFRLPEFTDQDLKRIDIDEMYNKMIIHFK